MDTKKEVEKIKATPVHVDHPQRRDVLVKGEPAGEERVGGHVEAVGVGGIASAPPGSSLGSARDKLR